MHTLAVLRCNLIICLRRKTLLKQNTFLHCSHIDLHVKLLHPVRIPPADAAKLAAASLFASNRGRGAWKSTLRLTFFILQLDRTAYQNLSCSIYPTYKYVTVAPIASHNSRGYLTQRPIYNVMQVLQNSGTIFSITPLSCQQGIYSVVLICQNSSYLKEKLNHLFNSSPASYEAFVVSLVTAALYGILSYWIAL